MAMTWEVRCKDCGKYVICMKPKLGKYPQFMLPCWSSKTQKSSKGEEKK